MTKALKFNSESLGHRIWATSRHYVNFGHHVETLNGGEPLSERQWRDATKA